MWMEVRFREGILKGTYFQPTERYQDVRIAFPLHWIEVDGQMRHDLLAVYIDARPVLAAGDLTVDYIRTAEKK